MQVLVSFSRTYIINVVLFMLYVFQDLACSINGTCLALIHAGISMNFLFAAVTFPIIDVAKTDIYSEVKCVYNRVLFYLFGVFLIFLFLQEIEQSSLTFVFENTSNRILTVESEGKFTEVQYKEAMEKCRRSSKVIFQFYKDMIKKYATKF